MYEYSPNFRKWTVGTLFRKGRKIFTFLTMIVAMAFFILLVILLKDNPEVMEKIIYTVGGVVIGAFGGYGFGKNRNDE